MTEHEALVEAAQQARENAHAPYSNFRVGAALHATSGRMFGGCNVENATYGLTVCAERVAIFSAVAAGARRITAVAVTAGGADLLSPCGACRQVLAEFAAPEAPVYCDARGQSHCWTLSELLPNGFAASRLNKG